MYLKKNFIKKKFYIAGCTICNVFSF